MRGRLIALAFVVGVAGCGGDDADRSGAPSRPTTTTVETPTSSSSSSTTVSAGEAGGDLQFPPSVTAPLPSQGGPMADGIHAVYLEAVDVDTRRLTVDVIQWLTGDEADEAYREETGEDGGVPNDYYIRNASQDQRQIDVAAAVKVTVAWDDNGLREREIAFEELPAYLAARGADGDDRVVFWAAVEYEIVTELFEQYRP